MPFYAQLDSNNVVHTVSELYGVEDHASLIEVNSMDIALIGKAYDSQTKTFNEQAIAIISVEDEIAALEARLKELKSQL